MIEPRDRDWGEHADWSSVPNIEAHIPALLAVFRTEFAQRDLFVLDDTRFTYGDIEEKSARLACQLLGAGVGKGAHVGLMLPTDETFLITWLAITRIGAVAVTLPTLSTAPEIQKIARHADLQLLCAPRRYLHHDYAARIEAAFPSIAAQRAPYSLAENPPYLRDIWLWDDADTPVPPWARHVDLSQEPGVDQSLLTQAEAQVHSSDPAGVIYTSGSTAEPKGVIHSQGSFVRAGMKLAASGRYDSDERTYASMPFFWVGGLVTTALCIMSVGGALLASKKTGAALLDFLERERMTTIVAWPHILRSLTSDPTFAQRQWSAMRNGLLYEALPPHRRPKDPTLMLAPLGMTETNGPYTIVQNNVSEEQRGSVGPLMRGIEGRLSDPETGHILAIWSEGDDQADSDGQVGVMQLRGDVMMLGMVKREHADVFTPDGWYVSGDLCSFRRGHLHFHGRADDLIKTAGANVSPGEVEAVLRDIAGVASANVAGVADRARGAVVAAMVVPQPGVTLDPETLRREAAKRLSSYKTPRVIVIREASEVPMLPNSKIDRRAIVKLLQDAHEG